MTQRASCMGVGSGILAAIVLLLLCPVHSKNQVPSHQSNEDLTFIDAEDFAPEGTINDRSKRQSFYELDSENDEGSGDFGISRTYRFTYTSNDRFTGFDLDPKRKQDIENEFGEILLPLEGDVDIFVIRVQPGASNRQTFEVDIIHTGIKDERSDIERLLRLALADSTNGLNGVPGSLNLREVKDREQDNCSVDQIPCRNGGCVPLCDGVRDCPNGEDEDPANCPPGETGPDSGAVLPEIETTDPTIDDKCPGDDKFTCKPFNNTIVVICSVQQCDNHIDCPLQEDEDSELCVLTTSTATTPAPTITTEVPATQLPCSEDQFRCISSGKCIPYSYTCNGVTNCEDNSDETSGLCEAADVECGAQEFKCDNKCLPADDLCDGKFDCTNGEDEAQELCAEPKPACTSDEFRCRDGTCIDFFRRCDTIQDCNDNDDEINCPCDPPNYQCNSGKCIKEDMRCDGHIDCDDGSDEDVGCPDDRMCAPGEFRCDDGECISIDYKCNYQFDCSDRSDEKNCPCQDGDFRCPDDLCVPANNVCDGIDDCFDASDESNCHDRECSDEEFKCLSNDSCIDKRWRCDSTPDCIDGSDEMGCDCQPNEFDCGHGVCIPESLQCDGVRDCPEFTDEENCRCRGNEFECGDGVCISKAQVCDGRLDCPFGGDEANCPTTCASYEFSCASGDECIFATQRCNGHRECADGSDELNCPGQCKSYEVKCLTSGECISNDKLCDGYEDCEDGFDEQSCPKPPNTTTSKQDSSVAFDPFEIGDVRPVEASPPAPPRPQSPDCPPYLFQCDNGQCVDESLGCDGHYDCSDGSDERNCSIGPVCGQGEFRCDTGDCIPQRQACDGDFQCPDASDELGCPPVGSHAGSMDCGAYEFKCRSGECISDAVVCDGRNDCLDRSDEANCIEKSPAKCDDREYKCGDGTCISLFAQCDGYFDCRDGSDETDCQGRGCMEDEYTCDSGQCISQYVVCDGRNDCLDNSDERDCPSRSCSSGEFTCDDGVCVPFFYRCDGKPDCADQSDEFSCPLPTTRPRCSPYDFTCGNGECIPGRSRCDGRLDCSDRSDEEGCPTTTTTTTTTPAPPRCQPSDFVCRNGDCVPGNKNCDGTYDCLDRSDEENCPAVYRCDNSQVVLDSKRCDGTPDCSDGSDERGCYPAPPPSGGGGALVNLQVSPAEQTIEETRQVVFRCRDTSDLRKPVRWVRQGGRPLPQSASDVRGRLTIENVQIHHGGVYFCEAQGVAANTIGRRKSVTLSITPFVRPTTAPPKPVCNFSQATCMSGECIPRSAVCDGDIDCSDGSDESRCDPLGCEPNEFQCDNGRCVQVSWICDSTDDCEDNSDERNCGEKQQGQKCSNDEFECQRDDYCVPKAFQCDNEVDCTDGSDEFGCSKPIIITPPKRTIMVEIRGTFTITCRTVGVPTPIVVWRLNWGHVPLNCNSTSNDGFGTLTCYNAQPSNQGAYSCEALNSFGSVFAEPDAILYVNSTDTVCLEPQFNAGAMTKTDCLDCFCFGVTQSCYSTEMHVSQLLPPDGGLFQIVGVNQGLNNGNFVVRDSDYPLDSRSYLTPQSRGSTMLNVPDRSRLGGPSDLLIYFSLPDSHRGSKLTSYGGHLNYVIYYRYSGIGQQPQGPDVIIRGNNVTLMHIHDGNLRPDDNNTVSVQFWPGQWYKGISRRGGQIRPHDPASRRDIMMVLENMDLLLIRASYTEGNYIKTTLSDIRLDTAILKESGQGRAFYVEECRCPNGYTGPSCQECARNYRRVQEGPYLGTCVFNVVCGQNEYGDPSRGIPCMPCPCPLTSESNRFSQSCYLGNDGDVTCNCLSGYEGRRCEYCSTGYEGNPQIPGDSCRPAGVCDPVGSFSLQPDPYTGMCPCKEHVAGPKCTQCQPGTFHFDPDNQYGCVRCFCMGKTDRCSSSSYYRTQEVAAFSNDPRGFQLVDEQQRNTINTNLFVDRRSQELVHQGISTLYPGVYYWKLPRQFLGDKVTTYGGNLTFTLRYVPSPGGQSSKNNAFDVEIYGNDITMRYFSKDVDIPPSRATTISVPFYEQYWQRQDGGDANREHFMMALADLKHIFIKATYTTNTQEVGLKEVRMDYAEPRNTGLERALAVEMCDCPVGYKGLSCEDCDVGYTKEHTGLNLGDCVPCDCNGHSTECDPEVGICINCRDNKAGDNCETCAVGYQEDAYGICQRVDPCACDPRGSLSTQCYNDQCQCKNSVEGDQCQLCKEGHFFLSHDNHNGCLKCWCSGVTNICSSYTYRREQIPMSVFPDHGFTLTDRKRINVRSDLDIDEAANEISFTKFNELPQGENYYWSLPNIFTGNRLASYGGKITVTQKYESQSLVDLYAAEGVIIITQDQKEFIWMNPDNLKPSTEKTYSIHLVESNFTVNQAPASRGQFLAALSSIEAILIRATYSETMLSTSLKYLMMDTAGDFGSNQQQALEVEQCSCPRQYTGLSCEQCVQGYYRDPISNRCRQCPCSGKEESCSASADGVVACNCLPGFSGNNCEISEAPSQERLEVSILQDEYFVDAGENVQMTCRSSSSNSRRLSFIWDRDGASLPYGRTVDNRQGLLVITQVRASDAGVYICRGSTGVQVAETRTLLTVSGGAPPSRPVVLIEESQDELHIEIGETIRVRCRASGNPPPQLHWIRENGQPLSPWASQENGILILNNAQTSDTGIYQCRGRNTLGSADATITIYVEDRPRPPVPPVDRFYEVEVSEDDTSVRPGETIRITCRVLTTVTTVTYTWARVQGSLPQQATQQGGELTIPNALPRDSGLYTCRASDDQRRFGEATSRIIIEERGNLPEVRIEPDRQTIYQGTSAELRCIASGVPKPSITWEKVNEKFSSNVRVEGDVLHIENALVTDRGLYACTATNSAGDSRSAAILEVERREPPVIEMYPETKQTIEKGSSALFQCHLVAGIPSPTISWARTDGRALSDTTQTLPGGVIKFMEATQEEEGSYICTATNDAGKMTAVATLEIQALPEVTIIPSTQRLTVQVGQRIRLECDASGDPPPAVSWQKLQQENYPLSVDGRTLSATRSVYEIARATMQDQGTYQCTAINSAGTGIKRVQVIVEDNLPGFPPSVLVTPAPPVGGPNQYVVSTGDSFEFTCDLQIDGGPSEEDLLVEFKTRDGHPLPADFIRGEQTVRVQTVTKALEGEYACILTKRITGEVITKYFYIQVVEPPRITLEPARQVVRPGDNANIRCSVTGGQPITITWSKEYGQMPRSVATNAGLLMFRQIEVGDAGIYLCKAVNRYGTASAVAEVVINEQPMLTSLQPNVELREGQDGQIRCEASGISEGQVRWARQGGRGVLPPNFYPAGNVIRIVKARPRNTGTYECFAPTPSGDTARDFVQVTVKPSQPVRILSIPEKVRLGDDVELICEVEGAPQAFVRWTKVGGTLPFNSTPQGRKLSISNLRASNGGVYICTATAQFGTFEKQYALAIEYNNPITYGHGPRSVQTRSAQLGSTVVINCKPEILPPVSYTWSKQGNQLPVRATINEAELEIPNVQADDAGTFICTTRNDNETQDISTLLIVTGVVPKFSGNSYLALPTLPDAYRSFNLEVSFKPESPDGLIIYNSQKEGPGDYVSFGLKDGYAEFRFELGSGPAVIVSPDRLTLGEWHTAKLNRNRKEGTMTIDDGPSITGQSSGIFHGLDLINPLYIGGVPDLRMVNTETGLSNGFKGCISRLVVRSTIFELMRNARSQHEITPCDTCSDSPCENGGVCQESYSAKGHRCICPAGFSGPACESTGQSCYPGVCGPGRCINRPGGYECYCPFGFTGYRCQHEITIEEPSFATGSYMSYPTPKALKRFSVGLSIKPETMEDGLIMYCAQQERGDGDFTSLAMRDKKLEFLFNTGTGTAVLQSEELTPGQWIKVHANRTDKSGSLRINDGDPKLGESPGPSRGLNLRTPLFLGGVDTSKVEIAPEIKVTDGFTGCISEIQVMDQPISIADSLLDSVNVDQCGVSACSRNPCENGATCTDDHNSPQRYICTCLPAYSGPRCEVSEGLCARDLPCMNGGVCEDVSATEFLCLCPLGYSGLHCEHESFLVESANFNDRSWIEVDRYLLPQDGISEQEVTMEFTTYAPHGLLFWQGQEPTVDGKDRDYISLGLMNGYVEFTFHMGGEMVTATSPQTVNDGTRHTVTFKRDTNQGTLLVDELPPQYSKGSDSLFSFHTHGNIYIGGTPDLGRMTGGKYSKGFMGCIHRLVIGTKSIDNFMDHAHRGINVSPCPSSHVHESHLTNAVVENSFPSVFKRTSVTTRRKTVTTRKIIHV